MNLLKKADGYLDKFFKVLYYLAGYLLMILLIVCAANVVTRTAGHPLAWADELQRFVMIWMTFLAAPVLIVRKEHLVVDLVATFVHNEKARRIMYLTGNVILLVFVIYFTGPCIELVTKNLIAKSAAMRIPMGYVYLCMPIGMILCAVGQLKNILGEFWQMKEQETGGTAEAEGRN